MTPTTFAALALAALTTLPAAGAWSLSNDCDVAILDVQHHLHAQGMQAPGTMDALKGAIHACPRAPAGPQTLPNLPVGRATVPLVTGAEASSCYFVDEVQGQTPDAPIGGFIQVGGEATPVNDHGPAQGIYFANTGESVYRATGQEFGFEASNRGVGVMSIEGAEFPASDAWADVGCASEGSSDLCWGQGIAELTLVGGVQVLVFELYGAFNVC